MTSIIRRSLAVVALVVTLGLGFWVGVAYAADQRLHDADNALQKAEALLQAATDDVLTGKDLKKFERHRERAILRVQQAREQIEKAILLADSATE